MVSLSLTAMAKYPSPLPWGRFRKKLGFFFQLWRLVTWLAVFVCSQHKECDFVYALDKKPKCLLYVAKFPVRAQ